MKINSVISSLGLYNGSYAKPQVTQNPMGTQKTNGTQNSVAHSPLPQIKELSNVFYYPLSFTAKQKVQRTVSSSKVDLQEFSGDFLVSKFNDVPCPACGIKMMNRSLYQKIQNDLSKLQPDEYLDYIGNYTQYMRPVEESVYHELVELSQKEGDKDVRHLVCKLREEKLPILQEIQRQQVKKIRRLAKTLPKNEKAVLLEKANGIERIIYKKNAESPFRRKRLLDGISRISISNPDKKKRLEEIANEFPVSSDFNSAWIVKYSGKDKQNKEWTSKVITERLVMSSVANTDHILAYNLEKNNDDITNYMSMHSGCNSVKSDKPFLEWLNEDKENRINYMKNYFRHVDGLIKDKKITDKKYQNYVAYATDTIYKVSEGKLKLEINEDEDKDKEKTLE